MFSELFRAAGARSADKTYWELGPLSNERLLAVMGASVLVQIALVRIPFTEQLFGFTTVNALDLARAAIVGLVPVSVIEIYKLSARSRS